MTMVKAHVSTHELIAGRYLLLDVVQRETNRVSWYGQDAQDGRPCLVTRIGLPEGTAPEDGRGAARGVRRMAATMTRLCPGRIAAVLDAVAEDGSLWTVTEWIDGLPLGQLIEQQGSFHPARAAAIVLEVLDVLEAAHGEGITHGELSPGQIFVRDRGPVVLTGFGLVGATLAPRVAAPSYASPEQARDERIGPAADLWALGAILYTLLEGRPPFRDRDRPDATLRGVDRLPLRAPLRAGQLAGTVQGLLRKDSRERLTRTVLRQSLTRTLDENPHLTPAPRLRRAYAVLHTAPAWRGRAMAAGTALAVVTVAVAALAATHQLPGTQDAGTDTRPRPSATAPAPPGGGAGQSAPPAPSPTPTAPASPSTPPSASAPPSAPASPDPGFERYRAPEGFTIELPEGWKRQETSKQGDLAYRITFGAKGDGRTLAVTYSTQLGPDPVAVWRDTVEPVLREQEGFRRIGEIRATTYQGFDAADMEWAVKDGHGMALRTFGRGFLTGGHSGFSLRWTTPEADWEKTANVEALKTFFRTFRPN
ncbi:serine/threonine-protein kinase [Streptomyces niveiscabiei]|uniref:serine/threonine protein kinase n=1 Tax=Streptomyces niveiscabiei TaxID=164115 RepID=UPI0029B24854|nr:serine/threonine-protein kinase [Streptomyces niveiscabiei]MDX3381963.1 serine/threonine-protein kinase [Streptomyces niveiscabiei]